MHSSHSQNNVVTEDNAPTFSGKCHICANDISIINGVSNHINDDGDIDHELDAEHVAIAEYPKSQVELVLEALGYLDFSEISQSDFNKLEDDFTICASNTVQSDETLCELRAAGFETLANQLALLTTASNNYDWSRENL
jgi:hypothetical protein